MPAGPRLEGVLRLAGSRRVQVAANQGAFLDLDGLLGERRIDWRFDLVRFDHRKVVVVDGRIGYVGGPGIEDHTRPGRTT